MAHVIQNASEKPWSYEEAVRHVRHSDAFLAFMSDLIDERFLSCCPRLKIISGALKGYDNVDVEACTRHGIWFCTVDRTLGAPTAELAIALALVLGRRVLQGDACVRSGKFIGWQPRLYGSSLIGATAGIVGLGEVGLELACRLNAMGTRVVYFDREKKNQAAEKRLGIEFKSLDELLRISDYVFPLLPLTKETVDFLDARAIAIMKRGSFLVNVGRGSIVDEHAVSRYLTSGHLGGYAADVLRMEDRRHTRRGTDWPNGLLSNPHTVFTPHLGTAIAKVREAIELQAAQSIIDIFRGKRPRGAINRISRK